MNLVQIQERLKEVPMQAVMAYANGMNPDVPPYLALGELNRRKRMEQEAATGAPPQGTVKDQIEAQVSGIAGMMPQGMPQQMPQGMPQMMGRPPMGGMPPQRPMPAQMPQQPVRMAGGGVAQLNVPDDVTMYGSGGIVAFADRGLVEEDIDTTTGMSREETARAVGAGEARLSPQEESRNQRVEEFKRAHPEIMANPQLRAGFESNPERFMQVYTQSMGNVGKFQQNPMYDMLSPEERAIIQRDIIRTGNVAPTISPSWMTGGQRGMAAPQAAPQGIAQVAPMPPQQPAARPTEQMGPSYFQSQLAGMAAPGQTYQQKLEAAAAKDPYLNKQPGELLEQYIKRMEAREGEEKSRFEQTEKDRARAALWKSLISAGEATRGQKGIGALFGGFGKAAGEEMEAARGREEAFAKGRREREDAIMKMRQEIENARIARSQGRFKEANEHDQKAEDYRRRAVEKGAEIEAADARDARRLEAEREIRSMPGAEERMFKQFADSWLAKPENKGKTLADALMAYKGAGSSERQDLNELKALQQNLTKQLENVLLDSKAKEMLRAQLNEVNRKISSMAGIASVSGGPKEGDTAKSNSNKPIIFRNGRWEYQ